LLLGAHFLRGGAPAWVVVSLLVAVMAWIPRRWAAAGVRIALALGIAEWSWTAVRLASMRASHGEPYLRMVVILLAVVLFTAWAAWFLPSPPAPAKGNCG